jgi:hypothetical protein
MFLGRGAPAPKPAGAVNGVSATCGLWPEEPAIPTSGASNVRPVTGGRPRRLLGPTVGSAVVLAVCALVVWGIALWVSWGGSCPNASQTTGGLDKGISVWPPAAQCTNAHGGTFWHEALPWATWLIGALILAAAAVLLTGLIVAIRDLVRPSPAAETARPRRLESIPPDAGGPDGNPEAGRETKAEEAERRAMAA